MDARVTAVEKAIIRIDATLPTLATRADVSDLRANFHKEMAAQTWRVITFVIGAGTVLTAAVYFIARNVTP